MDKIKDFLSHKLPPSYLHLFVATFPLLKVASDSWICVKRELSITLFPYCLLPKTSHVPIY
ncbi:hypothetical protein C3V44_07925 [Capnocytophaga sp. oral taxon 864]|nr:hypothetical protein C3V44_07925 [Capnocytophaga sp. oral taxon 864]